MQMRGWKRVFYPLLLTPATPPVGGWSPLSTASRKEEKKSFSNPLSATGGERVVERSNDRVSQLCACYKPTFQPNIFKTQQQ